VREKLKPDHSEAKATLAFKKKKILNIYALPVDFKADSAYTEFTWRKTAMRGVAKRVHIFEAV
jgi:hypothetical protein